MNNEDFSEFQEDFGIVSENKEDCYIINNLINKNKSISLTCDTQEKDFINDNINYIKIINDNGKYNIELIEVKYHSLFSSSFFYYEKFADPFYYETSFSYYYDNETNKKIYKYETFLKLQTLLSQFLIEKEKGIKNNKNIIMNIGRNAFPPNSGVYNYMIGQVTAFSIVICLQFSMTTYFFNMRMIDEKEKKLTILLERQGVSKKHYFFSWLISFVVLAIIPLFTFIIFF
jgi:hypothetical protein